MERPRFEMSGGTQKTPEKQEQVSIFNWHEFEPPWITNIREAARTNPKSAQELQEKEAQMESVAELAKEAGVEFRGITDQDLSADLLAEEGIISSDEAEFQKKRDRVWNSPLPRMISWGVTNGIITPEESRELLEWYKPEL